MLQKRVRVFYLEVGAGTGYFARHMQGTGWAVTALEPDETARKNAADINGIKAGDLNMLPELEPAAYDAITLWHVLEHVHDLHEYFKTFHKLLRPDGRLIIAVPNYTSEDAEQYGADWAAYDVPRHLYHFSPQSMQLLAKSHHFIIEKMEPMWFDSFYVSMLSEQYKTGSNHFLKAIASGIRSNIKAMQHAEKCSSVIYIIRKEKS